MAIREISVQEAARLLASDHPPRLIDVREADEWAICRLPGAELLPLSQWPAVAQEKLTDTGTAVIVQCHHGGRSAHAAEFLVRSGFRDVANLTGGIDAWSVEVDPGVPRY